VLATYAADEVLRDGLRVHIRAARPDDGPALYAAFQRVSTQAAYRRFFTVRRSFTDAEIASFTDVDFERHVALLALADEDGVPVIVGGGRYVICAPGCAEVAFTVIDRYQGQGIGSALLRHIFLLASKAGLTTLMAEVLAENTPMLKIFERWRPRARFRREGNMVHVEIDIIEGSLEPAASSL
jgi:GNAT superfamily N-acetyltransferase